MMSCRLKKKYGVFNELNKLEKDKVAKWGNQMVRK